MKKFLKWLFIAPFVMFGVWLIALFCVEFRESFIDTTTRLLNAVAKELERSL